MSEGICPQCRHLASAHTYGCNYLTCECTLDKADIEPHPYPGVIEYSIYQKYAKLQDELEKMKSDNVLLRSAAEHQPELDALNQAYENASRIASERLAENQQRRDENIKLAAENGRLKSEVMEWKALEIERKKAVLEMTGDIPSIERLVVRYTEKKQENERLKAALEIYANSDNWSYYPVSGLRGFSAAEYGPSPAQEALRTIMNGGEDE